MNTQDNIIKVTDPSIYDGWCVEFNMDTKEFKWRDAYFTERLSLLFKKNWEQGFLKSLGDSSSIPPDDEIII